MSRFGLPSRKKALQKISRAGDCSSGCSQMARSTGGWPYRFAGKQKRGERSETAIIKTRYLLEQAFPFIGERRWRRSWHRKFWPS